ncbi:redoxin [Halobacteriovorax sp. BALOs_7]|uniref:TlpA family protein disulfide reductase n=1 Tax=Halobacteriovorax sp. BALOs_7 TaxID=2109558 RepID=UPI000EB62E05|nr:TlpA disulfide reductase family protein [Halobacteriovorax sp. BALOs_7]AYF45749.1 redoxin [Halobacteriovorax sp. BALOs_7]
MKKILLLITFLLSLNINAQTIKDFTLPIYDKKESFQLKSATKKYKKIYLNFWASWCTACIQELDELEALKKKYESKGILFVAVNAGEKKKKIKKFMKKYQFSFLILEDRDRSTSKMLNVTELPRSIVIDNNMNILYSSDKPPKDL